MQYSAFASVCKTYDPSNDTQVWLAARFSLWVWAIDHYIDNELLPFLRNQDCSIEQKIAYLDEQLAILTEPLCSSGLLTYQEAQVSHLKPKHSVTPTPTDWEVPRFPPALDHVTLTDEMVTQHAFYIKEAFRDIYQSLLQHLNTLYGTDELAGFSLQEVHKHTTEYSSRSNAISKSLILYTFTLEVLKLVNSMRDEIIASLHFHLNQRIPDLETYLSLSVPSMYLIAAAALAHAFERDVLTSGSWDRWFPAMLCGSRAIRLVNDYASCLREMEEGKLSSVIIALDFLRYSVNAHYTLSSLKLQEALTVIRDRLSVELTTLESLIPTDQHDGEALNPLSFCILATISYAMSIYQQEDI